MQDLSLDKFGPYPILQFGAVVLVFIGLAVAVWRATQDRKPSQSKITNEQFWFFDGPIGRGLDILNEIKGHFARQVELKSEQVDEIRHLNNLLRDIKNILDERRRHSGGQH